MTSLIPPGMNLALRWGEFCTSSGYVPSTNEKTLQNLSSNFMKKIIRQWTRDSDQASHRGWRRAWLQLSLQLEQRTNLLWIMLGNRFSIKSLKYYLGLCALFPHNDISRAEIILLVDMISSKTLNSEGWTMWLLPLYQLCQLSTHLFHTSTSVSCAFSHSTCMCNAVLIRVHYLPISKPHLKTHFFCTAWKWAKFYTQGLIQSPSAVNDSFQWIPMGFGASRIHFISPKYSFFWPSRCILSPVLLLDPVNTYTSKLFYLYKPYWVGVQDYILG